jgi:hypothetical protein
MSEDAVSALEQLAVMKARGLVTDAEYEAKRAAILDRLNQPASPTLAEEAARAAATSAPPPAPAAQPAKKEGSAAGGLVLLILIIGGGWWFFGRGTGGDNTPSLPDVQPWSAPAGMTKYDSTTAYAWVTPKTGECISDRCWAMDVVTRDGCPTSLYVELSLTDSAGTNVGFTNDVAGVVSAGQKAHLIFDSFEDAASKATLADVTCY